MKNILLTLILFVSFLFIGCNTNDYADNSSVKTDDSSVNISYNKIYSVELTDFTNKLFQDTFKEENAVISPLSLYMVLSMVSNGASEETQAEFGKLLCGENYDENKLNLYNKALMKNADKMNSYVIANSLWLKETDTEKAFNDILKKEYKAHVDMLTTPAPINKWVKEKTKGKIPSIIDDVDQDDLAIIINAIYFKGIWDYLFRETNTETFYKETGEKVHTDFMENKDKKGYTVFEYKGGKVLKINCKDKTCMYFFLPPNGTKLVDYAKEIDFNDLKKLRLAYGEWRIFVPKFKVESTYDLISPLKEMGLNRCFDPFTSNFKRLSKNKLVAISKVIQKATIEVQEKGVEATAATAGVLKEHCIEEVKEHTLWLNRPFAFVIYNTSNDTVVFAGTVYDPSK